MRIITIPSAHIKALKTTRSEEIEQLKTFYVPSRRGHDEHGILFYKIEEGASKPAKVLIRKNIFEEKDDPTIVPQYFSAALKKLVKNNA